MAKLFQVDVKVIEQKTISPGYKSLFFSNPAISKYACPGQFLLIDCNTSFRRPFSISSVKGTKIEILYKIVGKGTNYLSTKKKGDRLNVFGPLGESFRILKPEFYNHLVFVAGGTGIASLRFLAQKIPFRGTLFYGTKTKNDIVGLDIFKDRKWQIEIATEDSSQGCKGLVTDVLRKHLSAGSNTRLPTYLYSAGPKPMLEQISKMCIKHKISGQVSLEEIIACGVGACRGCVVKTKPLRTRDKFIYKSVCRDGPVFDIKEILWD